MLGIIILVEYGNIHIPLLLFVLVVLMVVLDVLDLCQEEVELPVLMVDVGAVGHCLYQEVLWVENLKSGICSDSE